MRSQPIQLLTDSGGLSSVITAPSDARAQSSAMTIADVIVKRLSASEWRICDRRIPESDACSIIGFIEEKDGQFEVMELNHGFHWSYFTSLSEAIAHFPNEQLGSADLDDHVLSWAHSNKS